MPENATYAVDHGLGTAELTLTAERLIIRTHGVGLLDRPRVLDIAVTDLVRYAVVPVLAAQHTAGTTTDSQFIVTYRVGPGTKTKAKRVFVDNDRALHAFLAHLVRRHPEGSLLHLEPGQAEKQLGVMSAAKGAYIIVSLLVLVPIVVAVLTVALG